MRSSVTETHSEAFPTSSYSQSVPMAVTVTSWTGAAAAAKMREVGDTSSDGCGSFSPLVVHDTAARQAAAITHNLFSMVCSVLGQLKIC